MNAPGLAVALDLIDERLAKTTSPNGHRALRYARRDVHRLLAAERARAEEMAGRASLERERYAQVKHATHCGCGRCERGRRVG